MTGRLHQFEFSHFNEKVRWALDFKDIVHDRQSYLPGPHMPAIRKLSGQTQTPVLDLQGEVVAGSAAIIERLENMYPDPALFPADKALRDEVIDVQTRFDKHVGPAVRTVIFSVLVNDGSYLCRMFARSKHPFKQFAYRATFPLARGLIAKGNGVTDANNVERCFQLTERTLDEVAQQTQATGYMVGDNFTLADLTAAALLAPIADVAHVDMSRPKPVPEAFAQLVARFADHEAVAWVNSIYQKHR